MHVLTKIFIVLVSLLAVLLVPLVVVYAHNENSFKQRYMDASIEADTNRATLESTKQSYTRELSEKDSQIESQRAALAAQTEKATRLESQVRKLEADLASAQSFQEGFRAELSLLASSVKNGQDLVNTLVSDVGAARQAALAAEKRYVELDESFRDTTAALEVETAARRSLQEEIQRLSEEHAKSLDQLAQIYAIVPRLEEQIKSGTKLQGGRIPDKNLTSTVLNVERNADQVLVMINAGSRDGVKQGWRMTLARGGTFIGNLEIINVDIDRSVGKVSLESRDRGLVSPGDAAIAYAGQR